MGKKQGEEWKAKNGRSINSIDGQPSNYPMQTMPNPIMQNHKVPIYELNNEVETENVNKFETLQSLSTEQEPTLHQETTGVTETHNLDEQVHTEEE